MKRSLCLQGMTELEHRVAHLRLTPEGERRLARAFTELDVEHSQLRKAVEGLDG